MAFDCHMLLRSFYAFIPLILGFLIIVGLLPKLCLNIPVYQSEEFQECI